MYPTMSSRSSYSNDFLRKKGSMYAEQPALMTDRNAYVNFLEVQLERVSAACLGVQAYDQKFVDMQAMIVGLEQRCSSTTRLVALAQQCTEELRSNVFAEIDKLSQRTTSQHIDIQRNITLLNNKITHLDERLEKLSNMPIKIQQIERDLTKNTIDISDTGENMKKIYKEHEERIDEVSSSVVDNSNNIVSVQSKVSRCVTDMNELERRSNNAMLTFENKCSDMLSVDRDENTRKLNNLATKITYEFELMDNDIESREVKMLNNFKSDMKNAHDEIALIKEELIESVEKTNKLTNEVLTDEIEKIKVDFMNRCVSIEETFQKNEKQYLQFECDSRKQLLDNSNKIQALSVGQCETSKALNYLKDSLIKKSMSEEALLDAEIDNLLSGMQRTKIKRVEKKDDSVTVDTVPMKSSVRSTSEPFVMAEMQPVVEPPPPIPSNLSAFVQEQIQLAIKMEKEKLQTERSEQPDTKEVSQTDELSNEPTGQESSSTVDTDISGEQVHAADPIETQTPTVETVASSDPNVELKMNTLPKNSSQYMKEFLSIYKRDQDILHERLEQLASNNSKYEMSKAKQGVDAPLNAKSGVRADADDVVLKERKNVPIGAAAIYANASQAELNRLLPKPMPPWLPSKSRTAWPAHSVTSSPPRSRVSPLRTRSKPRSKQNSRHQQSSTTDEQFESHSTADSQYARSASNISLLSNDATVGSNTTGGTSTNGTSATSGVLNGNGRFSTAYPTQPIQRHQSPINHLRGAAAKVS